MAMRSMTGFGRGEASAADWRIEVELSGGNRKQLDVALSLPSALAELESELRRELSGAFSRGRVGVKFHVSHLGGSSHQVLVDEALAARYLEAARSIAETAGVASGLDAASLFRIPGLFRVAEETIDPATAREPLLTALHAAIRRMHESQAEEGAYLGRDLCERITILESAVAVIRERAPGVPIHQRDVLRQRLAESGVALDLDDERLVREIALFAERCDISEELTRFDCHLAQFRSYLESAEPVGRPLDFLCQEIHRELNTMGSKANDATIAHAVVTAKSELEKIREQVQNVE